MDWNQFVETVIEIIIIAVTALIMYIRLGTL